MAEYWPLGGLSIFTTRHRPPASRMLETKARSRDPDQRLFLNPKTAYSPYFSEASALAAMRPKLELSWRTMTESLKGRGQSTHTAGTPRTCGSVPILPTKFPTNPAGFSSAKASARLLRSSGVVAGSTNAKVQPRFLPSFSSERNSWL